MTKPNNILLTENQTTEKVYLAGTHRLNDPAETFRRITQKFAAVGLTRVSDVTGLDCIGIPVCMAVRPNSKALTVSQGKGLSLMAAKVSAAMESIEAWHAENIEAPLVTASYNEIQRRGQALDPRKLNLHPFSIYRPDLPLQWMIGYDLLRECDIYVPFDLVRLDFLEEPMHLSIFDESSNGLASGNHIFEAVSHAICEVVERHSTALYDAAANLPENERAYIDLATIDSPLIGEALEKLHKAGVEVMISNQTSDVGIPAFGCDIFVPDAVEASALPTFSGYGCHLSKEVAVLRAVTEAAQSRLTLIAGARDDLYWNDYRESLDHVSRTNWKKRWQRIRRGVDYRSLPSLETGTMEGDVTLQLAHLRKAGIEHVVALDLTKPSIGIPVARVIIPGLELRLGHRDYPTSERVKKHMIRKLMELMEIKQ